MIGDQDPLFTERLELKFKKRLESDKHPTQGDSRDTVTRSKHSLTALDHSSDKVQVIVNWVLGVVIVLAMIGVVVGWLGGFLYIVELLTS